MTGNWFNPTRKDNMATESTEEHKNTSRNAFIFLCSSVDSVAIISFFLGVFAYRDVGKEREQEPKLCAFAREIKRIRQHDPITRPVSSGL